MVEHDSGAQWAEPFPNQHRETEDERLLESVEELETIGRDAWRIFRIMGEFVEGFEEMSFVGPAVNPLAEKMHYDPFFPAVGPAYTAAFLDYLHNELRFGRDEEYRVSAFDVKWDWTHKQPGAGEWFVGAPNTVPALARAMTMNPGLHLLVQQGWYDLATPHLVMKHDIDHLRIPPEARKRIRIEHYEAGHMMYLHGPSMQKFRDDLAGFIGATDRL